MVDGVPNVTAEQSSVLYISNSSYFVSGGAEDWDEPADTPNDGLMKGPDRNVQVLTGTDWARVPVTVLLLDGRPTEPDQQAYEMVSERDLDIDAPVIEISAITDTDSRMTFPATADRYRVRVSVTGRYAGSQGTEGSEEHVVELWPTETQRPPVTVIGPDDYAVAYLAAS